MRWLNSSLRRAVRQATSSRTSNKSKGRFCVQELEARVVPSVAGTIFRDYNANGVIDTREPGAAGVTVTAYDSSGGMVGQTITGTSGVYNLAFATTPGRPLRVEFTNLPTFLESGAQGTASGTSVQFVTDGDTGRNFGVNNPTDYSQANPNLVTQVYVEGNATGGPNANRPVLYSFPNSATGSAQAGGTTPTALATAQQIGSTWGLAYQNTSTTLYAAAFQKRHAGYGPGGTGAIYAINTGAVTPTVGTVYTVANTGTDTHPTSTAFDALWYNDVASFDAVGKISLGGLDVSEDKSWLYTVNLNTKELVEIPIVPATGAFDPSRTVRITALPNPNSALSAARQGDIRPFAVAMKDGLVYLGMVDSAETSQQVSDLRAFVYTYNPATGSFNQVLNFAMNYNRGIQNGTTPAAWRPWTATYPNPVDNASYPTYNQGWLTGITFDNGSLVLGFRDRWGDQMGYGTGRPITGSMPTVNGIAGGDILRAAPDGSGAFTIENLNPAGTNPVLEFYTADNRTGYHDEVSDGGVVQIPGRTEVSSTAFDTIPNGDLFAGGIFQLSNVNGSRTNSYQLYNGGSAGTFGKSNGIGDLVALQAPPPIEIGNRIWNDANNNGIQDADEAGIDGLNVLLFQGNAQVGSTTTANGGQYYFRNLSPNTAYQVRVATNQGPLTSGSLSNLSPQNAGANDLIDSDAAIAGANAVIDVTTGNAGQNNHTLDIGFSRPQTLSLGNVVFSDTNNNGIRDNGEAGISGVTVNLLNAAGAQVASQQTNGTGNYLFTGLAAGTYTVEVLTPANYRSSTGAANAYEPAPNPSNNVDEDDNGTIFSATAVRSAQVTLTVGGAPLGEPATPGFNDPTPDDSSNLTVDFGFVPTLSLGNQVWNDANNDGLLNNGETGVNGVTVNLLNAAGTQIATQPTTGNGNYLFTGLLPGDYTVEIITPTGYRSSTGAVNAYEPAPDPDNNIDNDDNGTANGAVIRSSAVTLTVGAEPTNGNTNLTVDFGIYQPLSLGNAVFNDANNDGVRNNGESGIAGVTVNLLNPTGAQIATQQTNGTGNYLFTNLLAGAYTVEVVTPTGFRSSTGAANAYEPAPNPSNNVDEDDNGTILSATAVRSAQVTLAAGAAPTGEPATPGFNDPTPDANSNLTVDFGFVPTLSLGNQVWNDANNDGLLNNGEVGVNGVTVNLLNATGTTVLATQPTTGNGNYLFTGLLPGDYIVEIVTPAGYTSSTGAANAYEPAPDPDNNIDNDDNGTANGAVIRSGPVTLSVGGEPTNGNANLTVDFGLYQALSLGNQVWDDVNNDGLLNNGEVGVNGVTVRLFDAAGTTILATQQTTGNGNYLFTGLTAGDYIVEIATPAGYTTSTGSANAYEPAPGPNNDTDNDDNGTANGAVIRSGQVTLSIGGEPTNGNANLTVDFGIHQPLSLGNQVWNDANNDGLLNNGEVGVNGVTVRLYDSSGTTLLSTQSTTGNGNYLFTGLTAGDYIVEIIAPSGFVSSSGTNGSATGNFEAAPDPDNNTDDDDNGTTVGAVIRSAPVTLTVGGEPTNGNANLTVDFGIYSPLSLGNVVFADANNNGLLDSGETGLSGVTVRLLDSANGNAVIGTQQTNGTGNYLFTNLRSGAYIVEVATPASYTSSTGTNASATGNYEPAPNPSNNVDGDDNGTIFSPTSVRSAVVNLAVGGAPTGEPATPGFTDPTPDANSNLTVDFGFYQGLSLGNQVWNDVNNNGLLDNGEVGVNGVTVRLLDAAGTTVLATQLTATDGNYLFSGLTAGRYIVEVVTPSGYATSTGAANAYEPAPGPNNDVDDDDNGTANGAVIRSTPVTLTVGGEPTNGNTNLTVDFGIYQTLSLGNQVWEDVNNNGLLDNGEQGINGVTVRLLDAAGTTVLATQTTTGNGNYLFTGLTPGDYIVEIVTPGGYLSSTGTNGSTSGPYETAPGPNNDIDNDDNGTTVGTVIRSAPVALTVGGEPTSGNANLTVDFGVYRPLSLGNLVFADANNNGLRDLQETGIAGVSVTLLDAGNGNAVVGTQQTNATGNYLFTNLRPGSYIVQVATPNGFTSSTGPLNNYEPAPNPNVDTTDNDDNGTTFNATSVRSAAVNLLLGNAPLGEPPTSGFNDQTPDANGNLTVDFGFVPTLSLGNQVWDDANNNGLLDNGETGVNGVTVRLIDPQDGSTLATQTTSGNGNYLFTGLLPGSYAVEIDAPTGYTSSTGTIGSATGQYETAPSPNNDIDNDDNGTNRAGNTIRSLPIVLVPGTEPTNGNTNLTLDFGIFQALRVGDRVFDDRDNSGTFTGGDIGIAGVSVRIFADANADGTPDSATPLATTTTDANGVYYFGNLTAGSYVIEAVTPSGFISSTGATGSATGPNEPAPGPNDNRDNFDDGTTQPGGFVRSGTITLAAGTEPSGERTPGSPTGFDDFPVDANSNLTVDFGFFRPLSLGNLVWNDANNNGLFDNGEQGIPNVTVTLTSGATTLTTTTNASGNYLFTNLGAGTYFLSLTPPAGFISSSGTNGSLGGPYENPAPGPDNDINNDDNGQTTGVTISTVGPITLAPGAEPINDGDNDPNTNLTADFGLYRPLALGNTVWNDANNDGLLNNGEVGIAGIVLALRDSNGNIVDTRTTNNVGSYLFTNLSPGDYTVEFTPPAGFFTSTGTIGANGPYEPSPDPDNNVDNDDNGTLQAGGFIRSLPITLTVGAEPTNGDTNNTLDFGIFQSAALGNFVWRDANGNGIQDSGEPGVQGVTVRLLDATNTVVGAATTDANGAYGFTNLVPATYTVVFDPTTIPAGTAFTRQNAAGSTGANGSDADPTTGRTAPVTLVAGQNNPDIDAGLLPLSSIAGNVYVDGNDNGARNPGEAAIPNATLTLTGTDIFGTPVTRTTTTIADGTYSFTNLVPGVYRIRETQPPGFVDGKDAVGTSGGTLANDDISAITLGAGVNATAYDFGELGIIDIQVVQSVRDPIVPIGGETVLTFKVTNNGPTDALRTIMNTPLPAGLTFVRLETPPSQGTFDPSTKIWTIGTLPTQGMETLAIRVRIDRSGPFINTAVVSTANQETTLVNNVSPITITTPGGTGTSKQQFLSSQPPAASAPDLQPANVPAAPAGGSAIIATGVAAGQSALIQVFDRATGSQRFSFYAYDPAFRGGVQVAMGDITGDGVADIVTASGAAAHVKAFDGATGAEIRSFYAYPGFGGGVNLAVADVTGDGRADIITASGSGSRGHVQVFDGVTNAVVRSFYAYGEGHLGGASVAAADLNGDGKAEIITGAGSAATHVEAFDGETGAVIRSFYAFDGVAGGVRVAAGDTNGDGVVDIVVARSSGPSDVKILDGATLAVLKNFTAFTNSTGGSFVATADANADGRADVVVGAGTGDEARVVVYDGFTGTQQDGFPAYSSGYKGGVSVSAVRKV